jgi:AcrR family transcriptional regulator
MPQNRNSQHTTKRRKKRVPVRPKGRITRERVVDAARTVFSELGYQDTRVADIAAEAGVAHGTFYTYFESKEDVFKAVSTEVLDEIYAELKSPTPIKPIDGRISYANRRFVELYERHAPIIALIEEVSMHDPHFNDMWMTLHKRYIERIERMVRRRFEADPERFEGLDPYLTAYALCNMVEKLTFDWLVREQGFEREMVLATMDHIWLKALDIPQRRSKQSRSKDSSAES